MFTGIVEETGLVRKIRRGQVSAVLTIQAARILEDIHVGDSICVNGVCLTVVEYDQNGFSADVMHETLDRSSLASLRQGSRVNLERAMAADGRFGGHIVSGHVDGTAKIMSVEKDDNAIRYTFSAAPELMRYIVDKGSIAIDGISLTVVYARGEKFQVSVIPHTAAVTTLGEKHPGDVVNIENDIIGKYVEKLLIGAGTEAGVQGNGRESKTESGITSAFLAECGF
jgi:riboflavin synthase